MPLLPLRNSNSLRPILIRTRYARRSLSLMNEKLLDFHFAIESSEQLELFRKDSESTTTSHLLAVHKPHVKIGWTLTHIAAAYGNPRVLTALLKKGAPLDKVDMNGDTALHVAYIFGSMRCAKIIEQAGADAGATGICDVEGSSAIGELEVSDALRRRSPVRAPRIPNRHTLTPALPSLQYEYTPAEFLHDESILKAAQSGREQGEKLRRSKRRAGNTTIALEIQLR